MKVYSTLIFEVDKVLLPCTIIKANEVNIINPSWNSFFWFNSCSSKACPGDKKGIQLEAGDVDS
ncbi:MAG: hypothetical protein KA341_02510 [Saprospiraceae bacterium]|jgi:hypothetical protein|nr:hypothetical protein [Saprospiraceae bacterium]